MKLTLFALFSVILVTLDLSSDSFQSYLYYKNGDINWGNTTIIIVFIPLATICLSELMRQAIRKWRGQLLIPWIQVFKTISCHIPLVQPFIHAFCLKELMAAKHEMERSFDFYSRFDPDLITDENRKDYQEDVQEAAYDYVQAKEKYLKLMTDFQKMKLFEAFGESAPQAALQIGIVLQTGTLSTTQIFTICTSLFSLTLGGSEILLMMATKDKQIKDASLKTKWIIVFPAMFVVVVARILSVSLFMSYSKGYILLGILAFILMSLGINFHHMLRDPSEVLLGTLTNLFTPAIVIQEGSGFYKQSAIASSLLHILGLFSLLFLVIENTFNNCPITQLNRNSPIIHCFHQRNLKGVQLLRCKWPQDLNSSCTSVFKNYNNYETLNCTSNLISIDQEYDVTFCGESMPWWLPLALVCGIFIILHIIGIVLINQVLCKTLDPISMLKLSQNPLCSSDRQCFPSCSVQQCSPCCSDQQCSSCCSDHQCFPCCSDQQCSLCCNVAQIFPSCPGRDCFPSFSEPEWDEDKMELLEPISHFLEDPTMSRLQEADSKLISKTGRGLLDQAIQNDYPEIVKVILFDLNLSITHEMLVKAIKAGSPKVVKMFLAKEKTLILEESFQATDRKEMMMHQLEKKYSEDVEAIENLLENVDQNDWEFIRNRKELIPLMKKQLMSPQDSLLGELLEPISQFLDNPSMETLKEANSHMISKTGHELLDQAIQNNYRGIVKVMLE